MKSSKIVLLFASLIIVLVSCSVKRNIVTNYSSIDAKDYNDIIKVSNGRQTQLKNIKATLNLDIELKGKRVSSSAQFLCQKGRTIRIILVPLPFFEAARLWFTQQGVYMWDKINNYQVFTTYKDLSDRLGVKLNYDIIEAMFIGNIFTQELPTDENTIIECSKNKNNLGYTLKGKTKTYLYTFLLNKSALVDSVILRSLDKNASLNYHITSFQEPKQGIFIPVNTFIDINKDDRKFFSMDIDWRRVKVNIDDNFPPTKVKIDENVPSISIDEVLNKVK